MRKFFGFSGASQTADYILMPDAQSEQHNKEQTAIFNEISTHIDSHRPMTDSKDLASSGKFTILSLCQAALQNPTPAKYDAILKEIERQSYFPLSQRYTVSTGYFYKQSRTVSLVEKTKNYLDAIGIHPTVSSTSSTASLL